MEILELASGSFSVMLVFKTTLLLGLAFAATALLREKSAAARHYVWSITFVSLLALPAAAYLAAASSHWQLGVPILAPLPAATSVEAPAPIPVRGRSPVEPLRSELLPVVAPPAASATRWPLTGWQTLWLFGTSIIALRLAFGFTAGVRATRNATLVTDASWSDALARARTELGVYRSVQLRRSPDNLVPVTLGVLRATILLPRGAEHYSDERTRAVLLHELAHIRRHDCLTQWLCQIASATLWWHPLVWVAGRQMRALSERASDDLVLSAGTPASTYAHDLLDMAKSLQHGARTPLASVSMAHRSRLEERLLAILDDSLDRRRLPTRLAVPAFVLGAAVVATLSLAAPIRAVSAVAPEASAQSIPPRPTEPTEQTEPPEAPSAPEPTTEAAEAAAPTQPEQARREAIERAREALVDALDDADAGVREQTLHTLVRMQDPRSIPHLKQALMSDDPELRAEAVWGLGVMRADGAAEAVAPLLADDDKEVRSQAAWSLGMLRDRTAVDGLLAALRDSDSEVRSQAAWALGMIRDERAANGLGDALDDATDAEVGEQAVWALGMLRSQSSVDPLMRALESPHAEIRGQAAWALGMIRSHRAVDALIAATKDDDNEVREQALWALGRLASDRDDDDPDFDMEMNMDLDLTGLDVDVKVDPDPNPNPNPRPRTRPDARGADL